MPLPLLAIALICLTLTGGAGASAAQEPTAAPAIAGEAQTYTVAPGDGLYAVARARGLAFTAVARANGIEKPNLIRAGKTLTLPTRFILPPGGREGIVVNIPESRLFHFRGGVLQAVYPATVGLPTWQTPVGAFTVTVKVLDPSWTMPVELAQRDKVKREIVPPGPDNPLGDRWIGTSLSHTGIHSTNVPMTVGRPLSHGCVRLYPEHAHALFEAIDVGEPGEFVYAPVKAALDGEAVVVEVHPDVYGRVPDLSREAERVLVELGVWDRIDLALLTKALSECRGIPVAVSSELGVRSSEGPSQP
jgi:L,D-transpeptidase ErfK/SrfK